MLYLRRAIGDTNKHKFGTGTYGLEESINSIKPTKRRWRDYFIDYLLPPLIGAMIVGVVSIPYHLRIKQQLERLEKELGEVAIIANRALELAELEALKDPNTRKEFEGLERLTADSAQGTQRINNAQEPAPYQLEFTLTYPQK